MAAALNQPSDFDGMMSSAVSPLLGRWTARLDYSHRRGRRCTFSRRTARPSCWFHLQTMTVPYLRRLLMAACVSSCRACRMAPRKPRMCVYRSPTGRRCLVVSSCWAFRRRGRMTTVCRNPRKCRRTARHSAGKQYCDPITCSSCRNVVHSLTSYGPLAQTVATLRLQVDMLRDSVSNNDMRARRARSVVYMRPWTMPTSRYASCSPRFARRLINGA